MISRKLRVINIIQSIIYTCSISNRICIRHSSRFRCSCVLWDLKICSCFQDLLHLEAGLQTYPVAADWDFADVGVGVCFADSGLASSVLPAYAAPLGFFGHDSRCWSRVCSDLLGLQIYRIKYIQVSERYNIAIFDLI